MKKLIYTFLILLISGFILDVNAQTDEKWDINETRAPETTLLDYTASEGSWISLDVSPDGNQIVFDLLGHIYLLPIEGGTAKALTHGRSWNMHPRFSPDAGRIAFTSDRSGSDDIWILDLETDSLTNHTKSDQPVFHPTWAPDGESIYASAFDQSAQNLGFRYNFHGQKQPIIETPTFQPANQYQEHPEKGLIYFEQLNDQLYGSGSSIRTYDMKTGEVENFYQPAGGAFNPTLSPNGKYIAFGHRQDLETVITIRDLDTNQEQIIVREMDRDHQDYAPYFYGIQPGFSWHPDNERIFFSHKGKIKSADITSGVMKKIPFEAPVYREIDSTVRFKVDVPDGTQNTRIHRWAHRTEAGILYETLGDIYLHGSDTKRNLTESPGVETSPAYNAKDNSIYYAHWTDEELGAVYKKGLDRGNPQKISSRSTMYGGVTVSPDGNTVAYFRGTGELQTGSTIESMVDFELVLNKDGKEEVITEVSGTGNIASRMPLSITFSPDGTHLYYTEFDNDVLTLKRIRADGVEKKTLYTFPHSVNASLSPDLKWIAFREYHQSFITPFEYLGKEIEISEFDGKGFAKQISNRDGTYLNWPNEQTVSWMRADSLYERSISSILNDEEDETTTNLAISYQVDAPSTVIALKNAKVITMDGEKQVFERATIIVENNRITNIGVDIEVPSGTKVYDLEGHVVMPGMIDAHAHYGTLLSQFNLIEQNIPGLQAALAHGVTTMYELYGTAEKDSWIMDMLESGKMSGARLFSSGSPAYGLRFFRPKLYKRIGNYEEALELTRYSKELGATALKDYVNFTRERRHQLITAARELNMNVVSETAGNSQMNFAQIVDGFTGLEHSMGLSPLYQDVIELFKVSEIGVTPTLLVVYNGPSGQAYFNQTERVWENEKLLNFATKDQLIGFKRGSHYWEDDLYAPEMAGEMKKLYDAGVLVNMGGHGQMLGLDTHWELELFVQGGFSPMEALEVATINGAKYHGIDEDLGTLEAGKLADLIILEEDPSVDIKNLDSIKYVMKNGVLYNGFDASRVYPDPQDKTGMYFIRGSE